MTNHSINILKKSLIKKVTKISRPLTTEIVLKNILKLSSNNVANLSDLINKGHCISGFVPYFKNKTSIILGNFLSINYGIRKEINVIVGLLDRNFNVKAAKLYKQNMREVLVLKDTDFSNFKGNQEDAEYCIVAAISPRININHGGDGGNLRFWGVWSEFSSYVHSFPLPSPICFLRKNIKQLKGCFFDRMTYPSMAKRVLHFGPLEKTKEIEERGNLSGKILAQYGYTILQDENSNITSCFHNSPFTRESLKIEKEKKKALHVLPIPPVKGVDIDLFFGEACSSGSSFLASLWQRERSSYTAKCIEKKEFTLKNDDSLLASSLFDTSISSEKEKWITLKPLSGTHLKGFISLVFRNKTKNKCLDGIHSQSFYSSSQYSRNKFGGKPRSLKFCPFPFSSSSNQYSFLTICGAWDKDVKVRVRIFSAEDPSFELLFIEKIRAKEVKYIDLIKKLPSYSNNIKSSLTFISQLESEDSNLDGYLINISKNKESIDKLSIDHLTGG